MKRRWAVLGVLLGTAAQAETICVVEPAGEGWRCGTAEEIAGMQPGSAQRPDATRTLPPPLLIDPERLPRLEYQAAAGRAASLPPPTLIAAPTSSARGDPWSAQAITSPNPDPSGTVAAAATVSSQPSTMTSAEPVGAPKALAAVEPSPAPDAEPAPTHSAALASPAVWTQPEAATKPALELTQPSSIADWDDREYTLQLVAAANTDGFSEFAKDAGLDAARLSVIRLQHADGDWWLLCSGRYPDLASARHALENLPAAARRNGAWPRRLGPLKKDARP